MGMAASQARLLSITARIHDIEYQSQAIQNAKVQLSTQSDQVYNDYLEALNATTLTLNSIDPESGVQSTMTATFNNICSINKLTPASDSANYALVTNKGQLILPDDVLEGYFDYKDTVGGTGNAYEFAMYMIGESAGLIQSLGNWDTGDASESLREYENTIYETNGIDNSTIKGLHDQLQSLVGEDNSIYDPSQIEDDKEAMSEYNKTMLAYRKAIYDNYANDMYTQIQQDDDKEKDVVELDMDDFNYYVDIYNKIQACNGSVCSINDFSGSSGDAANDSEWLTNMVEAGLIRIENCTTDEDTGEISMDTINPSSDTNFSYTETTSIDKTALAKAEAEYEHELSKIDKKDKQYDMTLSKLESERTALTTEYDSVKKVIGDNIERTFGIFS